MIDKRIASCANAVTTIKDSDTVKSDGFGEAGSPIGLSQALIHTLVDYSAKYL